SDVRSGARRSPRNMISTSFETNPPDRSAATRAPCSTPKRTRKKTGRVTSPTSSAAMISPPSRASMYPDVTSTDGSGPPIPGGMPYIGSPCRRWRRCARPARPRLAANRSVRRDSRPGVADQPPLLQVQDALRPGGGLRVVRHHDDRLVQLRPQDLHERQHLGGTLRVQVAGRLV